VPLPLHKFVDPPYC